MVDCQLRPQGIGDPLVIAAMSVLPRERFVPEGTAALAYSDRPIPLGNGRAMMPPAALGTMLDALIPRAGERALVIGSATGYAANLLAAMGLEVTALESDRGLAARGGGVLTVHGPLESGFTDGAPYEVILIDGAIEHLPQPIVDQLADGGRLGTGIVEGSVTRIGIGQKTGHHFGLRPLTDAAVPRLPGFARPRVFAF